MRVGQFLSEAIENVRRESTSRQQYNRPAGSPPNPALPAGRPAPPLRIGRYVATDHARTQNPAQSQ